MSYKTYSGKWDMQEIWFDAVVYVSLAGVIAVAMVYGK